MIDYPCLPRRRLLTPASGHPYGCLFIRRRYARQVAHPSPWRRHACGIAGSWSPRVSDRDRRWCGRARRTADRSNLDRNQIRRPWCAWSSVAGPGFLQGILDDGVRVVVKRRRPIQRGRASRGTNPQSCFGLGQEETGGRRKNGSNTRSRSKTEIIKGISMKRTSLHQPGEAAPFHRWRIWMILG